MTWQPRLHLQLGSGVPADRKQRARGAAILACSQAWGARSAPQASYRNALGDRVRLDPTTMGSPWVELGNNGPHWLTSGGPVRAWDPAVLGPRAQHDG